MDMFEDGLFDGNNFYELFNSGPLGYHNIRTGDSAQIYWKKYDIDLSGFSGNYTLWLCGGRPGHSGNTDSTTSYRDITLIGAKEIRKIYVNVDGANLFADGSTNYGLLETTPSKSDSTITATYYPGTATELPYYYVTSGTNNPSSSGYSPLLSWPCPRKFLKQGHVYVFEVDAKVPEGNNRIKAALFYKNLYNSTSYVEILDFNISSDWVTYNRTITPGRDWEVYSLDIRQIGPQTTPNASQAYIRNFKLYDITGLPGNNSSQKFTYYKEHSHTYEKYFQDIKFESIPGDISGSGIWTYNKVSWLESTNTTSYINTQLRLPYGFRATGKIMFTEITSGTWQQIMGSQTDKDPYQTNGFRIDDEGHFALGESGSTMTAAINTEYTFDFSTRITNSYLKINNSTIINSHRHSSNENFISNYPLYIFSINNAGSAAQGVKMRLYWLKIYDAKNNLIADYTPVKNIENHGLYDSITNRMLIGSSGIVTDTATLTTCVGERKHRYLSL